MGVRSDEKQFGGTDYSVRVCRVRSARQRITYSSSSMYAEACAVT